MRTHNQLVIATIKKNRAEDRKLQKRIKATIKKILTLAQTSK